MKLIRISEIKSEAVGDRWLYQVLEHLDTFTLLECRAKQKVSLIDITQTLILDHFDEADNPALLLHQILNSECEFKTLIVVSTMSEFDSSYLSNFNFDMNIGFGGDPNSPSALNTLHVDDLDVAIRLVRNSLRHAA
ncbi:hypothetical protein [Microbulbifer sp. THAF38]|uniref:hypothetical protein n=1 Tax=Microbulbifer sp. THAF38 TaxID=2587856 RepID=UPI001268CD81|nr:hypothetical protein [Microbulbifer sp. THAF38]QFT57126.1 hypothetical protein FIU95_21475 [Microbulbifer sp. THAF38]